MGVVELIILIIALLLLFLAGIGVPNTARFNLLAFGIFFAVLAFALRALAGA